MTQPEKRFKVGACSASVFANQVNSANGPGVMKSVALQRTYKDKEGNFQHTTSFNANDIPKAVLALIKAYDYMTSDNRAD